MDQRVKKVSVIPSGMPLTLILIFFVIIKDVFSKTVRIYVKNVEACNVSA